MVLQSSFGLALRTYATALGSQILSFLVPGGAAAPKQLPIYPMGAKKPRGVSPRESPSPAMGFSSFCYCGLEKFCVGPSGGHRVLLLVEKSPPDTCPSFLPHPAICCLVSPMPPSTPILLTTGGPFTCQQCWPSTSGPSSLDATGIPYSIFATTGASISAQCGISPGFQDWHGGRFGSSVSS